MLQTRLNSKTRFAFGAGAMPETLKNISWDMFVLFYFTQVLGLSGSLAGVAIAISLVIDSIVDPSIGSLSDKMAPSRIGRRQKLMAYSVVPFGLSFVLLFSPPEHLGQMQLFTWLVVFAVICRAAISLFTIPLYAMGVELSRHPLERPLLISFKQVSTSLGRFLLPLIAFTFFFNATPEFPNGQLNRAAYPGFALAIALVSMALMVWCILGTMARSRVADAPSTSSSKGLVPLGETVRQVVQAFQCTPNVRWIIAMSLFMFVSLGIVNVYLLHLSTYYWKLSPSDIRNVSIALSPGVLLAAVAARYYVPVFNKRKLMVYSIVAYGVLVLVPILGPLLTIFPQPGSALQVPLLIGCKFLAGFAYGANMVTSATIASDVADELEYNAGEPRQALLSSVTFFSLGAASALVNIAAGGFLDLIAFPVGASVDAVPFAVVAQLAIFAGVIITVAVVAMALFLAKLDVSNEKQGYINEQLEARYRALRARPTADETLHVDDLVPAIT